MENFANCEESTSETDKEGQPEGERYFVMGSGGTSNQKQISNANTNDSLKGATEAEHDKTIASDSPLRNEGTSFSQASASESVFSKQFNETRDYKHGEYETTSSSRERLVHTTAQPYHRHRQLSNENSARGLHFISSALYEFSRQYKQLEKDTSDTNKALELTPSVGSLDTLRGLCQKTKLERKRMREIVAKLLLDCKIDESCLEFAQGVAENSDNNEETACKNCRESSTSFDEDEQVLHEVKSCNVCGQNNIVTDIYVQTEDYSICSTDKDFVETQTQTELDNGQTVSAVFHELEDLREKCKTLEAKCNGFQEKVFEAESELCSAEVERDLKSEEARYLEEQVGSVRTMLSMRENDLASLRKRYKFLDEAFQNSEELRERLEKETSQMTETIRNLEEQLEAMKHDKEGRDNIHDNNLNNILIRSSTSSAMDHNFTSLRVHKQLKLRSCCSSLKDTYVLDKMCMVDDHFELSNEVERLVKQLAATNDALKMERAQKESVDKMMSNVEKERRVLMNELDACKNVVQTQHEEMKKLRDQIHNLTKQRTGKNEHEKKQKKQDERERGEETNEKRIWFQSNQILQLEKSITQQSSRVHILQEENKRLEDELYQQLDIIENLGNENTLLRKEQENTTSHPGKSSLKTVEELVADDCSSLQNEKKNQDQEVKEYGSPDAIRENSCEVVGTTEILSVQHDTASSIKHDSICSCKIYSVPRSEHVKVVFELRALREEMKNLKEITVPGAMKKFTVKNKVLKKQRMSLKNENKEVKKWLKTMKDNITAVTVEDEMAAKHSIMLQKQLYEARTLLKNKLHDLEMTNSENALISAENKKQKDAVAILKQHLQQEKETCTNTMVKLEERVKQLEKQLQYETEAHAKVETKLVVLEEQRRDVSDEFEEVRLRLDILQREKEVTEKQFNEMKIKLINYFGNQSLEAVRDSCNSQKKECDEYVRIVENDKRALSETQRELKSLTDVNTVLRIELSEVKAQLQNEVSLNLQKVKESTYQLREIDRLQREIQTLGIRLENEKEILQINTNDKKELKRLETEVDAVQSELKQTKLLYSGKEKECQAYMVVIEELQTTCKVYEDEFTKISIPNVKKNASSPAGDKLLPDLEKKLSNISDDDRLSENESDSSVENLQELQHMFQQNLSKKVRIPIEKPTDLVEDGVVAVTDMKKLGENCLDTVMLETQLHEAKFNLNKKQHELNMVKIEKDILFSENKKREEALCVLKEKLIHDQETNKKNVGELKEKHKRLETQLERELEKLSLEKTRIVSLDEHNSVLIDELENLKNKFEPLQNEKELISKQFIQIKFDIIKYFGNESLQSVSNSLSLTKKKCAEYNKIIDNNKSVISENQREMVELKDINTKLKTELSKVKGQMEKQIQTYSEQIIYHKSEIGRLQEVTKVLERDLEKAKGILEEYSSDKEELKRLKSENIDFKSEINEVKILLTEKETECESLKIIVQELESTCKVYEKEFEKFAVNRDLILPKMMLLDLDLEAIAESEDEMTPESDSDSTVKNLQDFQETLQGGLSTKVKVLQNKVEELMNELTICRNKNESLQQRLYLEEVKNLEIEAEIVSRKRDEEFNKILRESSENEKCNEKNISLGFLESRDKETKNSTNNDNMIATLSHYKEIVRRLRAENTSYEAQLAKMLEETEKHNEKIAMLEYCIRENCEERNTQKNTLLDLKVVENNIDALDTTGQDNKPVSTHVSGFTSIIKTTANAREELECLMAKYINLKAAFEGCRRKLRYLEGEESMEFFVESKSVDLRKKQVDLDSQRTNKICIPGYLGKKDKSSSSETIDAMGETMGDSCLSFSEMSVTYSENETDKYSQNEKGGMTVEVTLEIETGLFQSGESAKRITEDELQECFDLRKKIEKLESLLLSSRDEIQRVKVCSFNSKLDFQTELTNSRGLNDSISKKLECLEQQETLFAELEGENHLSCHHEIERIKMCSLNERQLSEKAIKDLQNSNDAMKMKIDLLKNDKYKLNLSVEVLTKKVLQCCDEIHRIKMCSFNERSTFENTIFEIKETRDNNENLTNLKVDELEKKLAVYGEEIHRIKMSSYSGQEHSKAVIETLQTAIHKLEHENESMKKEKDCLELKMQEEIMLSTNEIKKRETILIDEKKKLEKTIEMLHNDFALMKNTIQGQQAENNTATSKIKALELAFTEEIEQSKRLYSSEKKGFELIISNLQRELENNDKNLQEQKTGKEQLKTRIVELEEKIAKGNDETQRIKVSSLNQRENLKTNLREKCKELIEFKKTSEKECTLYKSTISDLEKNVKNLQDETVLVTNKVDLTNDQLDAKLKSVVELEQQVTMKCQELDTQVSENKHLLKVYQDTLDEVQSLRKDSTSFANKMSSYKEEICNLETSLSNLRQKTQVKDDELKLFKSRLMVVQNSREDSERLLNEMNEEYKSSKHKNQAQEKETTLLKARLMELQKEKENTESVLKEIKEEVDNWKQKTKVQTEETAAVRKSLAASQQEKENNERLLKTLKGEVEIWKQKQQTESVEATVLRNRILTLEMERKNAENSFKDIIEEHRHGKELLQEKFKIKMEEIVTFENILAKLRQENITFKNALKDLNEENFKQKENINKKLEKCQEETDSWKQKCSAQEKKVMTLTTVVEQTINEKEISEDKIKEMNVEIQEQNRNSEHIIDALKQEINLSKTKIQSCEEEVTIIRHKLKEIENAKEISGRSLVEKNEKYQKEKDDLQQSILKYKNEIELLTREVSTGKNEIINLREENRDLLQEKENEINNTEQMAVELKIKDNNYREKVDKHNNEISTLVNKAHDLEKNASNLREQLKTEKRSAEDKIAQISNDKGKEVRQLLDETKNFKHLIDKLKTEKENAEKIISQIYEDKENEERRFLGIIEMLKVENKTMKDEGSRNVDELSLLMNLVGQLRKEKENVEKNIADIANDKNNLLEEHEKEKQRTKFNDNARRNAENESNRLVKIVEELQKENEFLSQEKSRNEDKLSSLTNLIEEIRKEGQNKEIHLQDIIDKIQNENELLKQNECKNNEQLYTLHSLVEKIEYEKNNTEINIKAVNATSENLCQEKISLQEKLTLARKGNLNLQKNFEKLESDRDKMKKQIEQLNLEIQVESKDMETLNSKLKISESEALVLRKQCKNMEEETTDLKNQINDLKKQIEFDTMEKDHIQRSAEKDRADLKSLHNEIEEVTKNKRNIKEEFLSLQKAVKKESALLTEEKEKHNQYVVNIQDIIDELMKGKQTLLEEIAMLSDKKKEMEIQNNKLLKRTAAHNESEKLKEDNLKLELQISSLKVSLHTLEKAYEQSQDENKQNERRLQELRTEEKNVRDKNIFVENNGLRKQITVLENELKTLATENRELISSIREKENQLLVLEKEHETCKKANIILMERLKVHKEEIENPEKSESGNSSIQMSNLRKKLKELRSKLGEEKKQREIFEFEIKNLKDKVVRLSKKEKEFELQLEGNRKKIMEMKTERDGLALDLESVVKRKKRDIEGYASTIESLESELKAFKGKKDLSEDMTHTKEEFDAIKENNSMLEIKLMKTSERYVKENDELKKSLKSVQERYDMELVRFRDTQTSNHNEVLTLKKSLSTVEREIENKARELEKLRNDFSIVNHEKIQAQELLEEKSSEANKWKKDAFDSKAEINFLKGALNILEKEGLTNQAENSSPA